MRINSKKHKYSAPLVGVTAPTYNKDKIANTITS